MGEGGRRRYGGNMCPEFSPRRGIFGLSEYIVPERGDGGLKVIRVWSYIVPNKGIAKRTLDYIAIPSLLSLPGCLSKQMWLWPHHRSFYGTFREGIGLVETQAVDYGSA